MNHNPRHSRRDIYLQHVAWAQRYAQVIPRGPHRNFPDPERRLRIGYVSPDFRSHPVSYFFEPVIRAHDRTRFEVYCYSETAMEDPVTKRLRSYESIWRRTPGLPDMHVARMIEEDGIDILVDLAGHTHRNRLAVFRLAPAPVQVSYLGYCNTTGYPALGWRIGDPIADPPGSQDFYTEKLRIIEPCFFAYAPPLAAPPVAPLPALTAGTITFGSLTNTLKLHPAIIELWSRVLHAVPNSRFLFARREIREDLRERLTRAFAEHGLGPDRIELGTTDSPRQSHLALYDRIDIALDTWPWSGHTTSCEALHMGVPVVTLTGDRHASRMVASLLNGVRLPQLIATTPEQYVSIARDLAADIPVLAELRKGLRNQLAASPVCDAEGFTRKLEAAYREMWRTWCGSPSAAQRKQHDGAVDV
jgi:predicted O-linked N-acetylglucosamine transferase (SPINDLY family)